MRSFDRIEPEWRRLITLYGWDAEELYWHRIPATSDMKVMTAEEAEAILIRQMGVAI